jgi:2,5-furandicarboxylate decarboxylase 1
MSEAGLRDLAWIVDKLDAIGRLARVKSVVDPDYELAGIAAHFEGEPFAVLFENVKGRDHPVLAGLYWSRALLADLLDLDEAEMVGSILRRVQKWQIDPIDPVVIESGPVLEVTQSDIDLSRIPIPFHALKDGGPYIDAGVVIARDPETGIRNASVQRFMLVDKENLAISIDAGRHLELYFDKAKERSESLVFTLNIGTGPGLLFAGATPSSVAPADTDELGIASEFEGGAIRLVKGTALDVEMAADAMYALECEIIPGELTAEGPFGEVTGFYAGRFDKPLVHVRAVHHRHQPIFHTVISGIELFNMVGLLGEGAVLDILQRQVPGVKDVFFSHGGGGFYHAVVQMEQKRHGQSKMALAAAFSAFSSLKMVTVVDDDVDIRNASDVEWAIVQRMDPMTDIVRIQNAFGHELHPGFRGSLGTKVGFDATRPVPRTDDQDRISYKDVTLSDHEIDIPQRS